LARAVRQPRRVLYHECRDIKKEKKWMTVNGHFFNAQPFAEPKTLQIAEKTAGWRPAAAIRFEF